MTGIIGPAGTACASATPVRKYAVIASVVHGTGEGEAAFSAGVPAVDLAA
jgi:hypothetical protein